MGTSGDESGSSVEGVKDPEVIPQDEQGFKTGQVDAHMVSADVNDNHESPATKFDERQGSMEKESEAETAAGHKSNGSSDTHVFDSGDGDLPSFSIKRLRRIPLRAAADKQSGTAGTAGTSGTADSKVKLANTEVGVGTAGTEEEKQIPSKDVASNIEDSDDNPVSGDTPALQIQETFEDNKDPNPHAVGATDSSIYSVGNRNNVPSLAAINSSEEQVNQGPAKGSEDTAVPISSPGLPNENHMNGTAGAPRSDGVKSEKNNDLPSSNLADGQMVHELVDRKEELGLDLSESLSIGDKETFIDSDPLPDSKKSDRDGEAGIWRNVVDSYTSDPISDMKPLALSLQVEDSEKENVAPETSKDAKSSTGTDSLLDKSNEGFGSPTSVPEVENEGASLPNDKNDGKLNTVILPAPTEPVSFSSPATVQILPPVLGSSFDSPEGTTDDEDSPRASVGLGSPGGDHDLSPLPYSGQIMYPGRYSTYQSPSGPSLIPYSGSMSLRSDSSTTSNRSFAFPILAPPEWNSSPVRMAKADPRYLRRRRRWDGCCFFRFGRSRYKY